MILTKDKTGLMLFFFEPRLVRNLATTVESYAYRKTRSQAKQRARVREQAVEKRKHKKFVKEDLTLKNIKNVYKHRETVESIDNLMSKELFTPETCNGRVLALQANRLLRFANNEVNDTKSFLAPSFSPSHMMSPETVTFGQAEEFAKLERKTGVAVSMTRRKTELYDFDLFERYCNRGLTLASVMMPKHMALLLNSMANFQHPHAGLLYEFARLIPRNLPHFIPQDIALVTHAYGVLCPEKIGLRPRKKTPTKPDNTNISLGSDAFLDMVETLFRRISEEIPHRLPYFEPHHIAMVLYGFAKLKIADQCLLVDISDQLSKSIDDYNSRAVITIVSAYAELQYDCLRTWDFLLDAVRDRRMEVGGHRGWVSVLLSVAKMFPAFRQDSQMSSKLYDVIGLIEEELCCLLQDMSHPEKAKVVNAMVKTKYGFAENLVKRIAENCVSNPDSLNSLSTIDLCGLVGGLQYFKLCTVDVQKTFLVRVKSLLDESRLNNSHSLARVLSIVKNGDIPAGSVIDKDVKETLCLLKHDICGCLVTQFIELIQNSHGLTQGKNGRRKKAEASWSTYNLVSMLKTCANLTIPSQRTLFYLASQHLNIMDLNFRSISVVLKSFIEANQIELLTPKLLGMLLDRCNLLLMEPFSQANGLDSLEELNMVLSLALEYVGPLDDLKQTVEKLENALLEHRATINSPVNLIDYNIEEADGKQSPPDVCSSQEEESCSWVREYTPNNECVEKNVKDSDFHLSNYDFKNYVTPLVERLKHQKPVVEEQNWDNFEEKKVHVNLRDLEHKLNVDKDEKNVTLEIEKVWDQVRTGKQKAQNDERIDGIGVKEVGKFKTLSEPGYEKFGLQKKVFVMGKKRPK